MKTASLAVTTILVLVSGSFGPANADSAQLLVPGYEATRDLPGARELPDPKTDYKVVFADGQDAKNPGDVNPMLPTIATYVQYAWEVRSIPAEHRHLVIMFHQRTADLDIVMSNDAYRERYNRDNPNIAIIHALKQAGVDIRVCGQGLIARKIDRSRSILMSRSTSGR